VAVLEWRTPFSGQAAKDTIENVADQHCRARSAYRLRCILCVAVGLVALIRANPFGQNADEQCREPERRSRADLNASKFGHIRRVNGIMGLGNPALVTPLELLSEDADNE
jgi:hypothetical protein